MRLAVDASCWANERGYGRFTRSLLRAFLSRARRHELVLFVDAATADSVSLPECARVAVVHTREAPAQAASASGSRSLSDLLLFSLAMSRAPADAFFFPSVYTFVPVLSARPVLVGIHDVIAEEYPDLVFPGVRGRALWTLKGVLARRQADLVVTVSEHAREGIQRLLGISPDRIRVVDEAADPAFRPLEPGERDAALLARLGLGGATRGVACLGGTNPHKNLGSLVDALAELRTQPSLSSLRLVLVGDAERDSFTPGLAALRERIAARAVGDAVVFAGGLSDAGAAQVLNAAELLALPSFSEGFGLPAVEAAACGTPVVATRNSPLPRLLEGGGLFIDPSRPRELVEALGRLLLDEPLRLAMATKARHRARALSWERSADQFEAILDEVEAGLP
jgi:glycosyltransferase involved in cell wall biosynthesis